MTNDIPFWLIIVSSVSEMIKAGLPSCLAYISLPSCIHYLSRSETSLLKRESREETFFFPNLVEKVSL